MAHSGIPSRHGFDEALNKFTAQLKRQDIEAFENCTLSDVSLALDLLQEQQRSQRRMVNLDRIQPFMHRMEQYEELSKYLPGVYNFSLFIWGPLGFIINVTSNFSESLNCILDMYNRLGNALPMLKPFESIFKNDADEIGKIFTLVLIDCIEFHQRTLRFFSQRLWKQLFSATWETSLAVNERSFFNLSHHQQAVEYLVLAQTLKAAENVQADVEMKGTKRTEDKIQQWFSYARTCTDEEIVAMVRAELDIEELMNPRKRRKFSTSTDSTSTSTPLRDAPPTKDCVLPFSMSPTSIERKQTILARYQYRPLKSRSAARLLKIRPAQPQTETLECELIEVHNVGVVASSKVDYYEYEALSWCWGEDNERKEVCMHNDDHLFGFMISPTLMTALKALRSPTQEKIVWADAICINQSDPDEKSEQVRRMDEIYAQAHTVRVWLGEGDVNSDLAFDFIRNDLSGLWKLDKAFESAELSRKWAALISLLQRPWFTRRWVIQEIALARNGILQCGSEVISWRDFADAVHLILTKESEIGPWTLNISPRNTEPNLLGRITPISTLGASRLVLILDTLFYRDASGAVESLSGLERLVSICSMFKATEPRDTIFALLSLAKDTHPNTKSGGLRERRPLYPVDYQTEFHNVCKDFVSFCIQNTSPSRALDIICRPRAPLAIVKSRKLRPEKRKDNLIPVSFPLAAAEESLGSSTVSNEIIPSWVCDIQNDAFRMHIHPAEGQRLARNNPDPFVGLPDEPVRYNASGNMQVNPLGVKFRSGSDFHSMFVGGFIYEQISVLAEPSQLGNIPANWFKLAGWHDRKENPPEQLWRTLVADQGPNLERCSPVYALVAKDCFQCSFEEDVPGSTFDITNMIKTVPSSIASTFLKKIRDVVWDRSLMLLDSGDIGLTHEKSEEGDFVCILYGCSVPVILRRFNKSENEVRDQAARIIQRAWRKRDEHGHTQHESCGFHMKGCDTSQYYYKLIGACYVHGIMYGEAMRQDGKARTHSETFELR